MTTGDIRARLRHIGVSNFPAGLLRQALEIAPVACNQVEYHPFLDQTRLLELAREQDVLITAYSPLAHGKVPDDPTLTRIGERHGKSAGQVALRWLLDQPGVSPRASPREFRRVRLLAHRRGPRGDRPAPEGRPNADPPWAPEWAA